MKKLFDSVSEDCSRSVTQSYSTSFSMATKMLHSSIRNHIYNIYGFVRFTDEIVDSFHEYPKEELLNRFCLLYTSPSPRDRQKSRMPSSA